MRVNRALLQAENAKLVAAALAKGLRPDKGLTYKAHAQMILNRLMPRWADTPMAEFTATALNEWVRDEVRVTKGKNKGQLLTKANLNTLDNSVAWVWREAVEAKAVPEDCPRPSIKHHSPYNGKMLARDDGSRSFFEPP